MSRLRTILRLMRSTKGIQQQLIRDQKRAIEAFQPHRIVFHIASTLPCLGPRVSATWNWPHSLHDSPNCRGTAHRIWKAAWYVVEPTHLPARKLGAFRKNILDFGGDLARDLRCSWTFRPFLFFSHPTSDRSRHGICGSPHEAEWPPHVRMTGLVPGTRQARHWTSDPALEDF